MAVKEETLAKAVADLCLGDSYEFRGVRYPTVNLWGLSLNREVWKLVMRELAQSVEQLTPPCDLLCPIPTSGLAVTGELYAICSIPMMASVYPPDRSAHVETELRDMARRLGRPVRVCLVDAVIHEGTNLYVASTLLGGAMPAEVVAAVAIADNDLIPETELDAAKKQLIAAGRLQSVFRISELVKLAKE